MIGNSIFVSKFSHIKITEKRVKKFILKRKFMKLCFQQSRERARIELIREAFFEAERSLEYLRRSHKFDFLEEEIMFLFDEARELKHELYRRPIFLDQSEFEDYKKQVEDLSGRIESLQYYIKIDDPAFEPKKVKLSIFQKIFRCWMKYCDWSDLWEEYCDWEDWWEWWEECEVECESSNSSSSNSSSSSD